MAGRDIVVQGGWERGIRFFRSRRSVGRPPDFMNGKSNPGEGGRRGNGPQDFGKPYIFPEDAKPTCETTR
jgi:hypothetical protein